jgi:hypothetical protein
MSYLTLIAGRGRIDRRRELVPELDLVTVRVGEEDVRLSRAELAPAKYATACLLHGSDRRIDVRGVDEAKAELRDPAALAHMLAAFLEHETELGTHPSKTYSLSESRREAHSLPSCLAAM